MEFRIQVYLAFGEIDNIPLPRLKFTVPLNSAIRFLNT